jgi:hypothetical protein
MFKKVLILGCTLQEKIGLIVFEFLIDEKQFVKLIKTAA